MGTSTSTGTLAAGESRTFNLAPASIPPPSQTSDTPQATQDAYDDVFRSILRSNGIPYYDTPRAWGYWNGANASGLMGANAIHPAVAGYGSIASELALLIQGA